MRYVLSLGAAIALAVLWADACNASHKNRTVAGIGACLIGVLMWFVFFRR